MNVAEVLEQQLSKHERQDGRGIQCATRTRNWGRLNGPFSRHIGYISVAWKYGTRNRCVSIIAIFILSFPRHEIFAARTRYYTIRYYTIRYDTIRDIETRHCSRWPCLLHNGYPAFRSLNCRRWLSRRPGRMFF